MISERQRDRLAALARLACCPSSPAPEWTTAAIKFFELHRKAGTTPDGLLSDTDAHLATVEAFWRARTPAPARTTPVNIWRPTEAEGNCKYPGLSIVEILARDFAYAVWLNEQAGARQSAARRGKL